MEQTCEGEGDVVGVVAPLGGVAQVIFHGVQVVEVGVQVSVHQDRGEEEDGNSMNHQILWQQYEERIERLSQKDTVSKFCMDAGFLSVVEIGQYFMTTDNGEQFYTKACREYTLPRNDGSSQPLGWIQGSMRIGPVSEVTTSYMYGKHGIEIRIWSLSQDNSQSWVRISDGTNKYVIDSNHNNTEIPADPHEEQASHSNVKVIAARSKAKAKPQKRELVDVPRTIPMNERKWIGIEPSDPSLASYDISKKVISLHSTAGRRWSNSILEN